MRPFFDLAITLPPQGSGDLLRTVHRQLRAAIDDGRLQPGLRLPSTRALAAALGVSRNTVVAAYDLLLSEGYLVIHPNVGTYVANLASQPMPSRTPNRVSLPDVRLNEFWRQPPPIFPGPMSRDAFRYDFRVGLPDKTLFPFSLWRRLSTRILRPLTKTPAAYTEPEGREALRVAITKHISYARAVSCRVENVVVTAGAQQAFDLLARILVTPDKTVVAVEEPGYPPLRAAFAAARAKIAPIPVDHEGLVVERLPEDARVIYVTPSHQCPLGVTLSARRRAALLDFAQSRGAVVIEDDYDGEFRFNDRPIDALQTLDRHGSVFYVGTFSKSLFPSIRLGYVVTPLWARRALVAAKAYTDWHCAVIAQDMLAAFIEEGHLLRHIRKMHKIYAERRSILKQSLDRHCGDRLSVIGADVGLHLTVELAESLQARKLALTAAAEGIRLQPLDSYATQKPARNGFALGYGMIQANQIDEAICRLAQTMDKIG
ncbi:PLP-dependent aminotransferase family protein [Methylomonas montana]|uniref:MocR-like pyridoxine biosynthesis transcription factor PdxR n=1 Tax=Methylomonas montana TaxID=3058963 RepID=UPI00265A7559|nr:PLP-dependent aminotransferase family protein [Methylomonas montana]WKJ92572.1 PLP-dependent aminotransferase family protein [Methylomonas montana]